MLSWYKSRDVFNLYNTGYCAHILKLPLPMKEPLPAGGLFIGGLAGGGAYEEEVWLQ